MSHHTVAVIVLTMGDRPLELDRSLRSALAQDLAAGQSLEVFCLGNGWQPTDLPDGVRSLGVEENLGYILGRNFAVEQCDSDFFMFLDDDAWIPDRTFLRDALAQLLHRPRLAVLAPRITDESGVTLRRWVPRARVGDPTVSGPAFSCPEGVSVYRRTAWDEVGGFPANFFYAHEGVDLCWRLRDRGWDIWFDADLIVHHPALPPSRHSYYLRLNARNRVWLARRNLPVPVGVIYVGLWTVLSLLRTRGDRESMKTWLSGWREGWTTSPGERHPMRWSTVFHLARLGQPPII